MPRYSKTTKYALNTVSELCLRGEIKMTQRHQIATKELRSNIYKLSIYIKADNCEFGGVKLHEFPTASCPNFSAFLVWTLGLRNLSHLAFTVTYNIHKRVLYTNI